nr:MAG TPA: hypothetical protein [Caudoviricetes sp.]
MDVCDNKVLIQIIHLDYSLQHELFLLQNLYIYLILEHHLIYFHFI